MLVFWLLAGVALAENVTFSTRAIVRNPRDPKAGSSKNVVVWLTPVGAPVPALATDKPYRLVQHNKKFDPHILVVPVGALVEFPNHDPYFHNVFSLFEGKRFDLGLYEAGSTRTVRFDKVGVSYIFCNIHAQMSAVVISIATPYYAISDSQGDIVIPNVPEGRYKMQVWYETAPDAIKSMTREIMLTQHDSSIAPLKIEAANVPAAHKNKYGRDYDPAEPASPAYERP
jgi:plastocyanin